MRHSIKLSLMFAIASIFTQANAQLTTQDRAAVAVEIEAALANYHQVFSTASASEMTEQIYGLPLLSIGTTGATTAWTNREEIETMLTGLLDNLRQQGWHRSEMQNPAICVLGSGSGFASGQFIRYREDGSEISRSGMAYVFQKKENGWKMTSFLAHEANQSLSCTQ